MNRAPANPAAAQARADMIAYNAANGLRQSAPVAQPEASAVNESSAVYRLTWPGNQQGVATVAGQWLRNVAGDIEAWYSAEQLQAALVEMQDAAASAAESRMR